MSAYLLQCRGELPDAAPDLRRGDGGEPQLQPVPPGAPAAVATERRDFDVASRGRPGRGGVPDTGREPPGCLHSGLDAGDLQQSPALPPALLEEDGHALRVFLSHAADVA